MVRTGEERPEDDPIVNREQWEPEFWELYQRLDMIVGNNDETTKK